MTKIPLDLEEQKRYNTGIELLITNVVKMCH